VRAEIIAIGTEILLGEIVDTNSAWIAQRLPELGIDLNYTSVVGDNRSRIDETLKRAWDRSNLIITTGGLGPTDDDMTREGIAGLLGEEPFVDPDLESYLRAFFASRSYPMPESNIKQAWLIRSARPLPNPRGTAPGWWVERDGRIIVSMPGVPTEMERMWASEVAPELEQRSDGMVLVTRTIKTVGIGEGTVDEMARPLYSTPGIGIGTYARQDGVHLRIGAKAPSREEAWHLILPVEQEIERIFGNAIWGKDEDTLEGAIGKMLDERGQTLSSMESCTGGLFASVVTDLPGAAQFFKGGMVTYWTDLKVDSGVDAEIIEEYGVISPETALAMARAVRERLDTEYGLGITGVAGPDPQEGKAPGTVHVAVAGPDGEGHISMSMNQGRQAVKRRAVTTALLLVRRALMGELPRT
jgi:nicotinamide-nucleotide amidase